MGQPFKLHSSRGTWTFRGERVQCSAKGHFWTHADEQVLYHVHSGRSASAKRGWQAGELAGAMSMASSGGRGLHWQLLQSSWKPFPSLQDRLNCSVPSPPAEEATPHPGFPECLHLTISSSGLILLLKGHFQPSSNSPKGISPVWGRDCNFFPHLEQFRF